MVLYVPVRTKVCFWFKTCVSLMHTNWHHVGCFFWPRENGQEFSLMSGERSFLNLFRDSRTPLDSIRDKLVTLIYFVIVQCPSVGTTWYSASCARNGYTWAARDLRLLRRRLLHRTQYYFLILTIINCWGIRNSTLTITKTSRVWQSADNAEPLALRGSLKSLALTIRMFWIKNIL